MTALSDDLLDALDEIKSDVVAPDDPCHGGLAHRWDCGTCRDDDLTAFAESGGDKT